MRTVYLNAAYFPSVELLSAVATAAILLYGGNQVRRAATASRSACSPRSSSTCRASSTRSSSCRSSTRPTSRAWRRSTRSSSCSTRSPTCVDAPGRRRAAARSAARSTSTTCRSPTAARTSALALRDVDLTDPARADGGAGGRHRRRQVDVRQAGRALLRPDRADGCWSTATTCATVTEHSLRSQLGDRAAGGLPVLGHDRARTSPSGGRARPTRRSRAAARAVGADEFIERLPDGLRHRGRRARRAPLGRASASWWRSRARRSPTRGS